MAGSYKMSIGIDNYCLHPLNLSPLEVLKWAGDNGAEGVQFSGLNPEFAEKMDGDYLKDLAGYAAENGLYLEWGGAQHIPFDRETWEKKDLTGINRRAAEQAALLGTRIVRSCSGGLMRWDPESPMTETLLEETAETLIYQLKGIKIAVLSPYDVLWKELSAVAETPNDSHAGELETSMMLYLAPKLVKGRSREEYPKIPKPFTIRNKVKYWPGGVWGNPRKASAAKGKRAMKLIVNKIIEIIDNIEKLK